MSLAIFEQWLSVHKELVDLISNCIGLLAFVLAVVSLIYNIRNNTKSRNYTVISALQKSVREDQDKFYLIASIRPRDQVKYERAAIQYFNSLELVCFAINSRWITGTSQNYFEAWMKAELDVIYSSATQGGVLQSLMEKSDKVPFEEIWRFYPPRGRLPYDTSSVTPITIRDEEFHGPTGG